MLKLAMDIITVSPEQLRQAADIQENIQRLQEKLRALVGGGGEGRSPAEVFAVSSPRRKFSQQALDNIRAGARKRWAAYRAAAPAEKRRTNMTEAGRRALAAAVKGRWAKAKAAGRNAL